MTPPVYRFRHGAPIVIGREVLSGDPAGYSVQAVLKATAGQVVPGPDAIAVSTFAAEFQPASVGQAAHWLLSISAAEAAAEIAPGRYAVDVKFLLDGEVMAVSDPAFIVIERSVSG